MLYLCKNVLHKHLQTLIKHAKVCHILLHSLSYTPNGHKTDSRKARGDGYPNILRDECFPIVPRMGLVGDITYPRTGEGFMYYSMVKDVVTGEILGDHVSERMTTELVTGAMSAVLDRHTLEDGCIFHSDRGSQYTSKAFIDFLSRQGIRQSFSRVGKPGDNSWAESFFAIFLQNSRGAAILVHRSVTVGKSWYYSVFYGTLEGNHF